MDKEILTKIAENIAASDWGKRQKHWFKKADFEFRKLSKEYELRLIEEEDRIGDELYADEQGTLGYALGMQDIERNEDRMKEISNALREGEIDPEVLELTDRETRNFDNFATNWMIALHEGDGNAAEKAIRKENRNRFQSLRNHMYG
jgi:hypothetical protein